MGLFSIAVKEFKEQSELEYILEIPVSVTRRMLVIGPREGKGCT